MVDVGKGEWRLEGSRFVSEQVKGRAVATLWLIAEGNAGQQRSNSSTTLTTTETKATCHALRSLASANLFLILNLFLSAVNRHYQIEPGTP